MDASPLMRLSPELRNGIYEHAFFAGDDHVLLQRGKVQHPLTRTCRQMRNESLLLYYASTRFITCDDHLALMALAQWLGTIGLTHALHIRKVTFAGTAIHGWKATRQLMSKRSDGYALVPPNDNYCRSLSVPTMLLKALDDVALDVRQAYFWASDDASGPFSRLVSASRLVLLKGEQHGEQRTAIAAEVATATTETSAEELDTPAEGSVEYRTEQLERPQIGFWQEPCDMESARIMLALTGKDRVGNHSQY